MSRLEPRVAILLATYNGSKWIAAQLHSLSAQTHTNWHTFVRDDGSTDDTIDNVSEFRSRDPRFSIVDLSGKSTGSPAGNFLNIMTCFEIEDFDYVAFCDQDDIWSPDKLKRALVAIRESGADGYSCDLVAFSDKKRRAWYIEKSKDERPFDYVFQGASAGCTYVFSREVALLVRSKYLEHRGLVVSGFSHDWLVYAVCRSHGKKWFQDKQAFVFYRQHEENSFGALPGLHGIFARAKLSKSGWYRKHVLNLFCFLEMSPFEKRIFMAVERFGMLDKFWLILNVHKFRRKRRDAIFLAVALLFGFF